MVHDLKVEVGKKVNAWKREGKALGKKVAQRGAHQLGKKVRSYFDRATDWAADKPVAAKALEGLSAGLAAAEHMHTPQNNPPGASGGASEPRPSGWRGKGSTAVSEGMAGTFGPVKKGHAGLQRKKGSKAKRNNPKVGRAHQPVGHARPDGGPRDTPNH